MLKPILVIYTLKNNVDTKYPNNIFMQINFVINVSKHKSLYIQLTFIQNQFSKINSIKINSNHH
jgi:hypothetical protein